MGADRLRAVFVCQFVHMGAYSASPLAKGERIEVRGQSPER